MADTKNYQWTTNIGGQTGSVGFGGLIGGIKLDTAVLDRITAEMRPHASNIVEKYGWLIAGEWSRDAAHDTGNYRNSIVSESHMEGDMTFIAQDGTDYGIFPELGTSRQAAQPALIPALERNFDAFCKAFGDLFK